MPSSLPEISVVIPNWNGQHFLERCLTSIYNQKGEHAIEVIIADNNSTDTSKSYLAEHFPQVLVVALTENKGFDGGVNAGINAAKAPLIFLLNNDTELEPSCITSLIAAAKANPKVGFFATKMLDFKDHSIIDSCGDCLCWNGRSFNRGQLEKDTGQYNEEEFVFGACAGGAVYRRSLFDAIGIFDETFFAYLEDVDISFRAQLAGFTCKYIPGAQIFHIGSATAGKGSSFSFKMMVKNHFHLIYKNYSITQLIKHLPKLAYAELRLQAAAYRQHYGKAYWWGVLTAAREWPQERSKRAKVQRDRKVSDEYLNQIILPNFTYKPLAQALKRKP